MNKTKWKRQSGSLRRLIRDLQPPRTSSQFFQVRRYALNFGAAVNAETKLWYIYNCLSNNCIATVRFLGFVEGAEPSTSAKVIIRYRPNSQYAGVLSSIKWGGDNIETLHAPTTKLARRSRWLRDELQQRTTRHYREEWNTPRPSRIRSRQPSLSGTDTLNMRTGFEAYNNAVRAMQTAGSQRVRLRDSRGRFISRQAALAQADMDNILQQQVDRMASAFQPRPMIMDEGSVVEWRSSSPVGEFRV